MKSVHTFFFIGTLIAFFIFPDPVHAQQSAQITLAGYKHEPTVATSASGLVTVTLKGDTLKVKGDFSDLNNWYHGAYIHVGKKGENGNQLFRLKAELNEDRTGGTFDPEANSFVLNQAQKELLAKGEFYINITSYDHKSGEIRGQIPPMG